MSSQTALIQLCMGVSKGEEECCAENGSLCKQPLIELHGMALRQLHRVSSHDRMEFGTREHGMVGENRQSMVRPVQFRIVYQHYSGVMA